ncbi:MAG: type II toxin-antitoxin system PemK/MazF family toxin [Actinomycetota bacterium]|nr:type II toxin-antitoxin system PemK/MazF family toxin [Actinomycetota bacterium]
MSGASALGHGQIWWADLDKVRPVVVLTRGRIAPRLSRVLVAPITTTARGLTTEVALGRAEGVRDACVDNLDNIQLVPAKLLLRRAGRVPPERWAEFCLAMQKVMAC